MIRLTKGKLGLRVAGCIGGAFFRPGEGGGQLGNPCTKDQLMSCQAVSDTEKGVAGLADVNCLYYYCPCGFVCVRDGASSAACLNPPSLGGDAEVQR